MFSEKFDLKNIVNGGMRPAIGLAISGREVRLATLMREKDQISVVALETAYLDSSLEHQTTKEELVVDNKPNADARDAFGLKDAWDEKTSEQEAQTKGNANLEILYKFLFKHASKKIRVGLNIPVSMAKYQRLDSADFKQSDDFIDNTSRADKDAGLGSEQHLLKLADGATVSLVHDQYPPFLNILREVNDFLGKKLHFGTMDTTELALANIARSGFSSQPGQTSVIVYIEDDFTRLIFMNGYELLHISSIINENAASPQVLDIISRRLMYEIDEASIPEINSIYLAGRCSHIRAKSFFAAQFKKATVEYLSTTALGHLPVESDKQEETFSEFAVAIALAWKVLQPRNPDFFQLNLIPQNLRDQQEIVKLDRYGYGLLALTGLIAFFITFEIISVRSSMNAMQIKNKSLEQEISHAREAVDDVLDIEDESKQLESNLSLVDDLAKDYDSFLIFLKKLNRSVQSTGDVWVNQITKNGSTYTLNGYSQSRLKIPVLADKLGGAMLNKVTRERSGIKPIYNFAMDNIKFDRDAEPETDGISLANFTTIPNFTKDYFAGNNQSPRSVAPPASQTPNRTVSPARNIRHNQQSSQPRSQPPAEPKVATSTTRSPARQSAPPPVAKSSNGAANHTATNGAAAHSQQRTASSVADRAPIQSQAEDNASYPVKRYFIEVLQSSDRDYAAKYAIACRKKGLRANISSYYDSGRNQQMYRVLLGNYPNRNNAQKAHAILTDALGATVMKNTRIIALDMPANN